MASLIVFLDLGGVINDKKQQTSQWQALVGECFVKLLGGIEESWLLAHQMVTNRLEWQQGRRQPSDDFVSFYQRYQIQWVRGMCELLGKLPPPQEECLALAYRAIASITSRVDAALPGAVEAIHLLRQLGYPLHLASGSCSLELAGYLDRMGVRHCFGHLYGADLINTFKEGPEYYVRLFADVGIEPSEAVVVDDSLQALGWAAQTGARIILISSSSPTEIGAMPQIESLAQLPTWLQQCS